MKSRKGAILINSIIYIVFLVIMLIDFEKSIKIRTVSSPVVMTFLSIGIMSLFFFIMDKGFLTINKMIYIFTFVFGYFTPFHQYLDRFVLYETKPFTNDEYLYANIIIIVFLIVYVFSKKLIFNKLSIKNIRASKNFHINENSLLIMIVVSIICLCVLLISGNLFSEELDSEIADSLSIIIYKILRFFPIASLLIYIFSYRYKKLDCRQGIRKFFLIIISCIGLIIYFPFNGTISRYLLFGTYLILIGSLLEKFKYKSLILLVVLLGFYFIFPAFNFFKYHTVLQLDEFELGGFDANFVDYDAYQVLLATIRVVEESGTLNGGNILSAILCIVPRSIYTGKLYPSGMIVAIARRYYYFNISCPLFAEFYLAGGMVFLIIGTIVFACITRILENGKEKRNILLSGFYYIAVGMALPFMRGAMLPMMSFLVTLCVTYVIVYMLCKFFGKIKNQIE